MERGTNGRRSGRAGRPPDGAVVVELFSDRVKAPTSPPGPDAGHLRELLDALAEVSAASLAYLRLATDLPEDLLTRCVEALAAEGLLTAEDRSDGHDARRTVALTAKGRRCSAIGDGERARGSAR